MRRRSALLLIFLSLCSISFGQYFSWGTEQTRIQWRQIQTKNFQVIYPKDFDSVAQEFTKKLEYVYAYCSKSLSHEPKKISVILHNHTNIDNASVAWCPSQMDVYTIPGQRQHAQDFYENLALHEFRHVVQTDKLSQGLTKILYFLLGEQAVGAVSGAYVPQWLFEGDAVCTETAFSNSGRGRQALFSMDLRAQTYEQGVFSYSKAYFGSYRDYVPNNYTMGYFLLANARKQYGQGLEAAMLDRAGSHPLSIRPINYASKKKTGLSRRDLYASIFEQQAAEWKLKHDRELQTQYDTICFSDKVYTNYINGYQLNDSVYFAERYGLDKTSQLIRIENGKEKVVANTYFKPTTERIQSNGKTIVWEETHQNIRWEMKQNSYIYIYDIEKNKTHSIHTKRHIFSPAISPSNERIAVSEIDEHGKNYLTIYDYPGKHIIKRIQTPENEHIVTPSWNKYGSKILYVALGQQGKRIMEYDVLTNSFSELLPYTYEDITAAQYWNEYILYTSSYSGVDNIYALNTMTQEKKRVTVADFGSRFPSTTDSTLTYSNYTSKGYQLAKIHLNPAAWHSISVVRKDTYPLAQMLTNMEGGPVDFTAMPDTTYSSKYYSKILHAINIHSWMPFCLSYNGSGVEDSGLGAQIVSQNKLGTTFTNLGYRYDRRNRNQYFFAKVTYKGLFPVFETEYQYGTRTYYNKAKTYTNADTTIRTTYSTQNIFGRVYFPLNFSSKSHIRQITFGTQVEGIFQRLASAPEMYKNNIYKRIQTAVLFHTFSLANCRATATREINPRFGQIVSFGYEHSLESSVETDTKRNIYSPYFFAKADIFFPGIMRSHSLYFKLGYEWNKHVSDDYYNVNLQIATPRGFLDENDIPTEKELISLQANYFFPIYYPDWELGDVLYVKRISCNLFADYAIAPQRDKDYLSYGAEFEMNFYLFNIRIPFSYGLRISSVPQKDASFAEFTFNIGFDQI